MRIIQPSILIGLALSVGACGTTNRGLESVHQPVVSRTNYALDLGAGYGGLSPSDTARLSQWFESLRLGYGDHVSVDGANDAGRDAVAVLAAHYGLLLDANAPVTPGDVSPGTLRVVVSRNSANVPGCPDWSRDDMMNFNEHNASNYGCAVNTNLAAMVADPQDLVLGRVADSAIDSGTAGKAIKAYRDKKPTGADGLKQESTGGK